MAAVKFSRSPLRCLHIDGGASVNMDTVVIVCSRALQGLKYALREGHRALHCHSRQKSRAPHLSDICYHSVHHLLFQWPEHQATVRDTELQGIGQGFRSEGGNRSDSFRVLSRFLVI